MKKVLLLLGGVAIGMAGGVYLSTGRFVASDDGFATDRDACADYLSTLRREIKEANADPEYKIGFCATAEEHRVKKEMIYLDDDYLSYRVTEYWFTGGAHGNTAISVGTLDRTSGKELTLADVFGKDGLAVLEKKLFDAVVAKIGKDNLQAEVKPIENFYLAADGWHFVYNEYEIACYAEGVIEVVIPR